MNKPIILAGGTGLIGKVLANGFAAAGRPVIILTRGASRSAGPIQHVHWDPEHPQELHRHLEGAEVVIGLAGATVDRRYNARGKWAILHSRISSTLALADALQRCATPPRTWVQLSTATIYRHAEDRPMDAYSGELGHGFSVEVARTWEAVATSPELRATRRVLLRCAMVLSPKGGVLPRLVQLTKLGFGGRHGQGEQFVSWIHEQDLVGCIMHILDRPDTEGIYDIAAPEPTRDGYLMELLRARFRPWVAIPQPRWLLEIGAALLRTETELVLKSRRVVPTRLQREGYQFRFPGITSALVDLLGDATAAGTFATPQPSRPLV